MTLVSQITKRGAEKVKFAETEFSKLSKLITIKPTKTII